MILTLVEYIILSMRDIFNKYRDVEMTSPMGAILVVVI